MGLRTLNTQLVWADVLDLLGCPSPSRALPAVVTCPLCRDDHLNVFEDTTSAGAWHYCYGCRHAGDMIELAAAVWKIEHAAAVSRLQSEGLLPVAETASVERYWLMAVRRRKRIVDYWAAAQHELAHTQRAGIQRLMCDMRIPRLTNPERWLSGPGLLLGGSATATAQNTLLSGQEKKISRRGIFQSHGWANVLAVLFESLPRHPSGILLVGRDCWPEDQLFIHADVLRKTEKAEAGLAGLVTLRSTFFPEHVFALDDPFLAVRLQVRHFQSHGQALPIVAYRDTSRERTARAWVCLERRRPIFWGPRLSASMLNQAILTDGLISVPKLLDVSPERFEHYLRLETPLDMFKTAFKAARPWREFLTDWVSGRSDSEAAPLLEKIERYGHDQALLSAGKEVQRLLGAKRGVRTVLIAGGRDQRISERNGMWYMQKRCEPPILIFSGTLRVKLVRECGEYVVVLRAANKKFSVVVPVDKIHQAERLFRAAAAKNGVALYTASTAWGRRLVDIALLFQTPE